MDQSHVDSNQQSSEQKDDEKRADNDSRARRPYSSYTPAVQPPKPANARQKWDAFRPSKTMFFWSLAGAVVLTMLVGFTWGGWTTASGAQKLADDSAKTAVTQRLAPICVAQFNLDPARDEKLKEFQGTTSYQQGVFVREQLWATMPGDTEPSSQVAAECAKLLMQIGQ